MTNTNTNMTADNIKIDATSDVMGILASSGTYEALVETVADGFGHTFTTTDYIYELVHDVVDQYYPNFVGEDNEAGLSLQCDIEFTVWEMLEADAQKLMADLD